MNRDNRNGGKKGERGETRACSGSSSSDPLYYKRFVLALVFAEG